MMMALFEVHRPMLLDNIDSQCISQVVAFMPISCSHNAILLAAVFQAPPVCVHSINLLNQVMYHNIAGLICFFAFYF